MTAALSDYWYWYFRLLPSGRSSRFFIFTETQRLCPAKLSASLLFCVNCVKLCVFMLNYVVIKCLKLGFGGRADASNFFTLSDWSVMHDFAVQALSKFPVQFVENVDNYTNMFATTCVSTIFLFPTWKTNNKMNELREPGVILS